ncbi:hypothetical protein [Amycolatopsis alkalitolerans]|uniref:Uncharacterized protein n=1 Tax=Amycolatopsis alkalitolerans TaxID=2547244 RepID=A0A5C4M7Y9_9PSEU|nr:hypothetical protein [Amycolatopsis alkalitolerans]TNC27316.1 hypothetical protein FG385_09545 [Amycolatopsis alkalitolerans]
MPEPILISIAAALAGKAATSLYDLVKKKFAKSPEAVAELEAATPEAPETIEAVAERLESLSREDPEFGEALRAEWARHDESVTNTISGKVHGKVVQARDIHGDIHF